MRSNPRLGLRWALLGATALACADGDSTPRRVAAPAPEIEAYVAFLERPELERPIDYILGLFDEADLVVLGERAHPEVTQYDLIAGVISDPRFIERVGHVFTEIGAINTDGAINRFLSAEGLNESQRDAWRRRIYRDFSEEVLWKRFNYWDLLRTVYELNQRLPADRKVRVHPVGLPFSWEGMTREEYDAYMGSKGDRDRRMAEHIVDGLGRMEGRGGAPAKALVIMNYRHSFPHLESPDGTRIENTTGFLFEMLPGRVRNVMLNTIAFTGGHSEADVTIGLANDGRWDAAFAALGNPQRGFDFPGSPFGTDPFDLFPFIPGIADRLAYQDVYTGFVFWNPVSEHRMVNGIPGIVSDDFVPELRRRMGIAGGRDSDADRQAYLRALNTPDTTQYTDLWRAPVPLEELVGQWLATDSASRDIRRE